MSWLERYGSPDRSHPAKIRADGLVGYPVAGSSGSSCRLIPSPSGTARSSASSSRRERDSRGVAGPHRSRRRAHVPLTAPAAPADAALDRAFGALGDATRRAILSRLAEGSLTVGEIADPCDISLNAVSKQLRVLERAGLIQPQLDARAPAPCACAGGSPLGLGGRSRVARPARGSAPRALTSGPPQVGAGGNLHTERWPSGRRRRS
ncbi:MAG: ArsR family transcriptional regulator [Deltaproteobacteria bacterium]|nr:MAG: ArsR family transcriptional regulator [Deltaproteobacteria bacterium]